MTPHYIDYGLMFLFNIIFSGTALIISIRTWHKSRVYYDIEMYPITGNSGEINLKNIKEKLNTGKYTIVNTYVEEHPNNHNNYLFVLLGKIKK
jgi:hypothetical protein